MSEADSPKARVFQALERPGYRWRTPRGIAKETDVPEEQVLEILRTHPDVIVRASVPSVTGEALFSTRRHYRRTASMGDRLLGALANQIL